MADYRYFKCKFWSDPYITNLSSDGKLIFAWLFTNEHTNLAGVYPVSQITIAFETGCSIEVVKETFKKFEEDKKITYTEDGVLWVKNFLIHQNVKGKAIKRVLFDLKNINDSELVKEFLEYYSDLEIPSDEIPNQKPKPHRTKKKTNPKEEIEMSDEEKEVLEMLNKVEDFPVKPEKTVIYLRGLREDFPDVNFKEEIKKKIDWWIDNPIASQSNPHLQIRNWFIHAKKFLDARKKDMRVGLPAKPVPEKDKFGLTMKERHDISSLIILEGADQLEFWEDADNAYSQLLDEWNKSNKKAKTFIDLVDKYKNPFLSK